MKEGFHFQRFKLISDRNLQSVAFNHSAIFSIKKSKNKPLKKKVCIPWCLPKVNTNY